jgi:hypothetical protein
VRKDQYCNDVDQGRYKSAIGNVRKIHNEKRNVFYGEQQNLKF